MDKRDISTTCGMHYEEYWKATNISETMTQKEFDAWLNENCYRCRFMSEICMK